MTPILVAGPAVEPFDVPAFAAYLRLDDPAEDALLAALVKAARLTVEAAARLVLVDQTWRLVLDAWPRGGVLRAPLHPVTAVTRLQVTGADGAPVDIDPALLRLDPGEPARLLVDATVPAPTRATGGIAIEVRAGFGPAATDVPEPLRQAVRMLAARWFENRGDAVAAVDAGLPGDIAALIAPFRRWRV